MRIPLSLRTVYSQETNCTLGQSDALSRVVVFVSQALERRTLQPGLVHHSDRGVQYASCEYTDLLKDNGILISMSCRGNPYDNAKAESFMKTLKMEEVYLYEYENLGEARSRIGYFLEDVYNQKRLHSAIGYVPPAEFEQSVFNHNLLNWLYQTKGSLHLSSTTFLLFAFMLLSHTVSGNNLVLLHYHTV